MPNEHEKAYPIFTITRGDKEIIIYSNGQATGIVEMLGKDIPVYVNNRIRFMRLTVEARAKENQE